ncbi:hypothetical protein ABZX85_31180 [Streptomyces sp. NPDC004539]|uniref:hypothetical protein n=1 Tax=Streptomyces sp. NPDC004539 TaxID=3154280 RepID=UPI0033A44AFC
MSVSLGLEAAAGRFAEDDLVSILEHVAAGKPAREVVRADEAHSVQSGTIGWQALGRQQAAAEESRAD